MGAFSFTFCSCRALKNVLLSRVSLNIIITTLFTTLSVVLVAYLVVYYSGIY